MLIDTERLRWVRPSKGDYVWTSDPAPHSSFSTRIIKGTVEIFKSYVEHVDHGPKEYLIEAHYLRRPGESEQEYDARLHNVRPSEVYTPGNIQNLYKRFAFTEPTKDQVMVFAETYGMLGLYQMNGRLDAEPILRWIQEILSMRHAFCLWRAIKREDEQALSAMSKELEDSVSREPPGTVRWAWQEIARTLTFNLGTYEPVFRLMYSSTGSDATGLQLRFAPGSLISLIWLQFAAVVTSGNRWNICQYCEEPFEVRRKGQKACSESHRQMAYRKRKSHSASVVLG